MPDCQRPGKHGLLSRESSWATGNIRAPTATRLNNHNGKKVGMSAGEDVEA